MAKITSKLQVTIPKALAEQYGLEPGDEIEFQPAGPQLRVVLGKDRGYQKLSRAERLRLFDAARARPRAREQRRELPTRPVSDRGWTREELYTRGQSADDQTD